LSFQGIEDKLELLIRATGNVPSPVLAGGQWYQMTELSKTSTFTLTDDAGIIDTKGFNLIVIQTDGNIGTISYKKTFLDGTQEPLEIEARIDNRIVGEITQLNIANDTAETGLKIFVEKFMLPPALLAAIQNNIYSQVVTQAPSDALSTAVIGLNTNSFNLVFDRTGVVWDRLTGTESGSGLNIGLLAIGNYRLDPTAGDWNQVELNAAETNFTSAARTSSENSATEVNSNFSKGNIFTDVTAVSGCTPTLIVNLLTSDPLSGNGKELGNGVTITGTGVHQLIFGTSGVVAGTGALDANTDAIDIPIPDTYQVRQVIGGSTPSFTASIATHYSQS